MVKTLTTITILIREGNFTRSSIFDVDEKEIFRGDGEVQIFAAAADDDDADRLGFLVALTLDNPCSSLA